MLVRLLLIALLSGGLIAVHAAYKERPHPADVQRMANQQGTPARWVGRLAPDVTLPLLDGSTFRLSDEVGSRVIVLNFFATWCGPCRAEMPELARFQAASGEKLRLIGVDAQETREVVEPFLKEHKVAFPVGIDASGEILKQFEVTAFPTTIVIGGDGRVRLYEVGEIVNADVALGDEVTSQLAMIAAGHRTTPDRFRAELASSRQRDGKTTGATSDPVLTGRAERIAKAMPCPCGCDDQLDACSCRTATRIKQRLAGDAFGDRSDAAIMEALNKEFCMKGM
jgi:cytochrome c biogenesis protein CcmG, thiol:disulfide interchange protein DsbE